MVAGGAAAGGAEAMAQELVAIHPGLMCRSESALAKLTRDDGSARTAGRHGSADDVLKATGGCVDFAVGAHVTTQQVKVGTSEVSCDIGGVKQTFVIANQDFMPAKDAPGEAPSQEAAAATSKSQTGASEETGAPATPARTAPPAASNAAQIKIAVTGLELGMSEDDAHLTLGSAYAFEPQAQTGDADVDRVTATGHDPSNSYRLGFIDQQLWFVNHMVVFRVDQRPGIEHLVARLKAKYGKPTLDEQISADGYRAWWQYDASRHPLATAVKPCLAEGTGAASGSAKVNGASAAFQDHFSAACPWMVSVLVLADPKQTDRVERLQVIMANPTAMYEHQRQDGEPPARKGQENQRLNQAAAM